MQTTINVNLRKCDCPPMDSYTMVSRKGAHFPECPGFPVPIPLSLQPFRSVTFTVRLGECRCDALESIRLPGQPHFDGCPARPIRVTFTISGRTWAESEPSDVEGPSDAPVDLITVCRERWALVKALVLGKNHDPENDPYEARALFAQRDAVFAALADMARAERGACNAQQRVDEAFPSSRYAKPGDTDHRAERPSVNRLARYVEHIVEQVGVLP